ncbi:MAG: leucine--tRNA ligase [SAR324 cluster bacterium]|nr:leucine--tRNA ligase [SAR324 cluster bacterium]
MGYQPQLIEKKWQDYWVNNKVFAVEIDHSKEKLYILDMFPYPSGDGLHVGHVEGYTATDIYSRYKRMRGFNVLHAIGWDAFGLPAENYAIKTGQSPKTTTERNIANFKRQIKALGFSYDWDREITTCEPDYFKWTQWIFLKIYQKGLAYQENALVNWCEELKAVLANEEVIDGLSEIGSHPVIRKPLRQWLLKITDYADVLEKDLDQLNWPKSILEMQKNWIGRSQGANCKFSVVGTEESFLIYTTKPDTLFGVTYCVLAPEHELVKKIVSAEYQERVDKFLLKVSKISDRDRIDQSQSKSGVFTGSYALNPVNDKKIPIWIADYVLMGYGTGAIMAVPAHDERDQDFAQQYGLPSLKVIEGDDDDNKTKGVAINSDFLNGLKTKDAISKMIDYLESKGLGERTINYRLRDWIFSRQRYWGEPIPILLDNNNHAYPLKEEELPLCLPEVKNYQPSSSGESPLKGIKSWVECERENKTLYRETNTMPQWAGSCWYYLRFLDPKNDQEPFSKEAEKYWMPVDLYVGGAEHAVLHLLYARFWHKVLYDYGYVSTKEPFARLINQGIILGEDGVKMSKSRGNVVSPDEIINTYGADTLRMYEMFLGPLEKSKPWQSGAIEGCYRFLHRVWGWLVDEKVNILKDKVVDRAGKASELKLINGLIEKITDDFDKLKFNTAISALMIFLNEARAWQDIPREVAKDFILLLSPLAPHIAEELWQKLGEKKSLSHHPWPKVEAKWLVKDMIKMPVQVNGKMRATMVVEMDLTQQQLLDKAMQDKILARHLSDVTIKKVIYVKNRIINFLI